MVISINYNEGGDPIDYKSVEVSDWSNERFTFDTGDFVKDWYDAIKKALQTAGDEEPIMFSSSVDHFVSDGAPYDFRYLHVAGLEKPELNEKYGGIQMFVAEGTNPTWEELREMCGDPKKK